MRRVLCRSCGKVKRERVEFLADNPFYNPVDRGADGLPDAEDYVWASGYRNPFGGAWRDVVALESAICTVIGDADLPEGRLIYRGYDIHDLAAHSTFEETTAKAARTRARDGRSDAVDTRES